MSPRPDPDPTVDRCLLRGASRRSSRPARHLLCSLDERAENGEPRPPDQDQELSKSGWCCNSTPPAAGSSCDCMAASLTLGASARPAYSAHRVDRAVRESPRADRSGQTAVLQPRRSRRTGLLVASWSRARWGGPPRLKGTPIIRPAWVPPTLSLKPRYSHSTTRTALKW